MRTISNEPFALEILQQHYRFPLEQAAHNLGVCTTALKKMCRQHGIERWPFRKLRSLEIHIKEKEDIIKRKPHHREKYLKKIAALKAEQFMLLQTPVSDKAKAKEIALQLFEDASKQVVWHQFTPNSVPVAVCGQIAPQNMSTQISNPQQLQEVSFQHSPVCTEAKQSSILLLLNPSTEEQELCENRAYPNLPSPEAIFTSSKPNRTRTLPLPAWFASDRTIYSTLTM